MEPLVPNTKLEPGVFQGTPESPYEKAAATKPPLLIRTMKSDMAEAVKNQNETSVSIAIAEEKKRAAALAEKSKASSSSPGGETAPAPKRIGRFVFILIVLLIGALVGLGYVFLLPKLGALNIELPQITLPSFGKPAIAPALTAPSGVEPLAPSLIPAQSEKRFNLSNATPGSIFSGIIGEHVNGVPQGTIKNLYFTEMIGATSTAISASRLISFVGAQIPDILTRTLEKQFMTGFLGESGDTATPFIVLKVSDHNTGLAGMLEWEPSILNNIVALFGMSITGGAPTKFHDVIILGKDARALETSSGAGIFYAFADQSTIVITGSRSALETLLPLAVKN